MKRDNINYLVVGSVVIAAMLLFLYVLYRLTGGVGENDLYLATYDNVGPVIALRGHSFRVFPQPILSIAAQFLLDRR